jgi:hypothetical protein
MASRKKVSPKKTGAVGGKSKGVMAPQVGHGKGNLPSIQDQKTMKKKSKKVGRARR